MRKRYILLKDTPELRKGAILEEKCDDGDQEFACLTMDEHGKSEDQGEAYYTRQTVIEQPDWFQELTPLYLGKKALAKLGKLLKEDL